MLRSFLRWLVPPRPPAERPFPRSFRFDTLGDVLLGFAAELQRVNRQTEEAQEALQRLFQRPPPR